MTRTFLRLPVLLGGLVALGLLSILAMPAGQAVPGKEEIKDDQKFDDEATGFGMVKPDSSKWVFVAQAEYRDNEDMVAWLRLYDVGEAEQQKTMNPRVEFRVTAHKHGYKFGLKDEKGRPKGDVKTNDPTGIAKLYAVDVKKQFKELKFKKEPGNTALAFAKAGKEFTYSGVGNSVPALYVRGVVFAHAMNQYTFVVMLFAYEGNEEKDKDEIKYVWDRIHVSNVKKRNK